MKLQDAINLIGTLDNASGQVCQMKDGKPVLILFDLGCANCSEVATKNADEVGEALATVVNAAPLLLAELESLRAACRAMATAETPQDALKAAVDLRLLLGRPPIPLETCSRCGAPLNNVSPGFSATPSGLVCALCLGSGEEIARARSL